MVEPEGDGRRGEGEGDGRRGEGDGRRGGREGDGRRGVRPFSTTSAYRTHHNKIKLLTTGNNHLNRKSHPGPPTGSE